jgi:hypothetical protein
VGLYEAEDRIWSNYLRNVMMARFDDASTFFGTDGETRASVTYARGLMCFVSTLPGS